MIREYDVVYALKNLTNTVRKGCTGTVLIIYPDFPVSYEIEFVDENSNSLEILTVAAELVSLNKGLV